MDHTDSCRTGSFLSYIPVILVRDDVIVLHPSMVFWGLSYGLRWCTGKIFGWSYILWMVVVLIWLVLFFLNGDWCRPQNSVDSKIWINTVIKGEFFYLSIEFLHYTSILTLILLFLSYEIKPPFLSLLFSNLGPRSWLRLDMI